MKKTGGKSTRRKTRPVRSSRPRTQTAAVRRKKRRTASPSPRRRRPPAAAAEAHGSSMTAVAADALERGALPGTVVRPADAIPREGRRIRCGDPDQSVLDNEYAGDDLPGGSTPTPDQNVVDEIGRAYGVQEEDSGALRASSEILEKRDRKRSELVPPPKGRE